MFLTTMALLLTPPEPAPSIDERCGMLVKSACEYLDRVRPEGTVIFGSISSSVVTFKGYASDSSSEPSWTSTTTYEKSTIVRSQVPKGFSIPPGGWNAVRELLLVFCRHFWWDLSMNAHWSTWLFCERADSRWVVRGIEKREGGPILVCYLDRDYKILKMGVRH